MNTASKKTILISKKQKILIGVAGVIIALFGWWGFVNLIPHPLGDKLEYLGKKDYGCITGLCDSGLYSVYFYATDMNIDEVLKYFKKSSVIERPDASDSEAYFGIRAPTDETIYTSLYSKEAFQKRYPDLFTLNKQYVLEIPSFKYDAAKASL